MKIALIGAGNVATHLGLAFKKAGHTMVQVYSRTAPSANRLAKKLSCPSCTDVKDISIKADLYIIALSDHAVTNFLKSFSINGKVIVHTSGSLPLSILIKKSKSCGVIYPLQTFSMNRKITLADVPFCIEGSNAATRRTIEAAVKSISRKMYKLDSLQRKQAHLAAVFANNFSNHLFTISEKLLKSSRLPFELIRPLILETALKVQSASPAAMQTGPAKRGDAETIEAHLKMLKKDKELHKIYALLSKSISLHHGPKL